MAFLYEDTQNEFLIKWIQSELTFDEYMDFINSQLYKNLVISKTENKTFTKHPK
ncbi:hypothetical protein [Aquimarina sp. 2201CG14-23]|uniref:hypothetical protein n=1 Tax=Aquimarina mycalae TaxID=3040073 RepID=UPI002477ED97|nr:hypothetical protein [Aquimarina sp. 2201CG14-23]MDH7447719.1 hypothetical protein [Aquimarina sp. 2201CG14-23]